MAARESRGTCVIVAKIQAIHSLGRTAIFVGNFLCTAWYCGLPRSERLNYKLMMPHARV
jgi:hypothetical protein